MKTRLLAVATALAAIAISMPGDTWAQSKEASARGVEQPRFQPVYSPAIPKSMELCGERIDLDVVNNYERLDRELTSVTYTHGTTLLIIKRANRYFPEMAPILKRNGVPLDMLYLACCESSLNQRAYSGAKAAGLWQFIESTAKQYGLEVSSEVDERFNIHKATEAACRYLKKAYAKYGDWPSVMAAYNGGMARISTELEKQGQDTALDLYLTEETSRYPFRIMALKAVMENPALFGFRITADQLYQPRECREVTVSGPVEDWPKWAADHGITYSELREENPWIRAKTLTNKAGKTYTVRIPRRETLSRSKQKRQVFDSRWIQQ